MKYFDFKPFSTLIAAFLILISVGSWSFALKTFQDNRADIVIELAEVFENIALPFRIAQLSAMPRDQKLLMPLINVHLKDVADTWGEARSENRVHEGVDIFSKRGTAIFSATSGYVLRVGVSERGGNYVFVIGPGGVRYYYAHLDSVAQGISRGDEITTDTVLGFVGNTGNAQSTPPHLHFGVYASLGPENPHPLLLERYIK